MSESLVSRVRRLVAGSVSALIDAMEGAAPEAVMEHAIREMDDAIDDVRAELGHVIANRHMATSRLDHKRAKLADLDHKVSVAVDEQRDELAEAAIAQQLDIEAQIPVLEQAIRAAEERERELEGYITALQAKMREMREELREFRQTHVAAAGGEGDATAPAGSAARRLARESAVERAEAAFDRVMDRAANMPGGARAADGKTAAQLAELEELARQNRIRERLAAAKARTAGAG